MCKNVYVFLVVSTACIFFFYSYQGVGNFSRCLVSFSFIVPLFLIISVLYTSDMNYLTPSRPKAGFG